MFPFKATTLRERLALSVLVAPRCCSHSVFHGKENISVGDRFSSERRFSAPTSTVYLLMSHLRESFPISPRFSSDSFVARSIFIYSRLWELRGFEIARL